MWPCDLTERTDPSFLYAEAIAHASAHTKGAWVEIVQYDTEPWTPSGVVGAPFDITALQITRLLPYRSGVNGCRVLWDIGKGPDDTHVTTIVANLPTLELAGGASQLFSGCMPVDLPVWIPKGEKMWLRIQVDTGAIHGDIAAVPIGRGWRSPRAPIILGTVGADTAATRGTQVTSGTGEAFGDWTELSASLPYACRELLLSWGLDAAFATDEIFTLQIGVGGVGVERAVWAAENIIARTPGNAGCRPLFYRVRQPFPRGERLVIRTRTVDVDAVVSDAAALLVG